MPTIQGREYQHATLEISGNGIAAPFPFSTFSEAKWKVSAEKKPVYNHKGQIIDLVIGEEKNEASLKVLLTEWRAFRSQMEQEFAPLKIGQIRINMTFNYGSVIADLEKVQLIGVMFQSDGIDSSKDQEALMVDLPLAFVSKVPAFINYDAPQV